MEESTPKTGSPQEQLPARTPLHEATEKGGKGQTEEQQERPGPASQTLLDLLRDDWA